MLYYLFWISAQTLFEPEVNILKDLE